MLPCGLSAQVPPASWPPRAARTCHRPGCRPTLCRCDSPVSPCCTACRSSSLPAGRPWSGPTAVASRPCCAPWPVCARCSRAWCGCRAATWRRSVRPSARSRSRGSRRTGDLEGDRAPTGAASSRRARWWPWGGSPTEACSPRSTRETTLPSTAHSLRRAPALGQVDRSRPCPAASASGSCWRGPLQWLRRCCCSTSRRPISIRRIKSRWSSCCAYSPRPDTPWSACCTTCRWHCAPTVWW